jgi:hypothetical protein
MVRKGSTLLKSEHWSGNLDIFTLRYLELEKRLTHFGGKSSLIFVLTGNNLELSTFHENMFDNENIVK